MSLAYAARPPYQGPVYTKVADAAIRSPSLSSSLAGALAKLLSLAEKGQDWLDLTDREIAVALVVAERTVQSWFHGLESVGQIVRERFYSYLRDPEGKPIAHRCSRRVWFQGSQAEVSAAFRAKKSACTPQKPAGPNQQNPAGPNQQEPAGPSSLQEGEEKKNAGPDGSAAGPPPVPAETKEEQREAVLAFATAWKNRRPATQAPSPAPVEPPAPETTPRAMHNAIERAARLAEVAIATKDPKLARAALLEAPRAFQGPSEPSPAVPSPGLLGRLVGSIFKRE